MHTALVKAWGEVPKYEEVPELPEPEEGWTRIKVEATCVHQVTRSRASGKHYSAQGPPHMPGVDGVGTTADGRKVYFSSFATGGSFSDYVNIPTRNVIPLPSDADANHFAAMVNPGLSSWMALKVRTTDLPESFTAVIMGATSASGRIAISLARACGAGKVIGLARNQAALDELNLDQAITIAEPAESTDFSALGDVDVVLDYVYGPLAVHLFKSLKSERPTQYVHVGGLSAQEISLPGSVLRSKNLTIRGAGPGAYAVADARIYLPGLLKVIASTKAQPVRVRQLKDVEKEWVKEGPERLVFVP